MLTSQWSTRPDPQSCQKRNIVFCCLVFLGLESGDGRTDRQHVRKQLSLPAMTLGWPSGSMCPHLTNKNVKIRTNRVTERVPKNVINSFMHAKVFFPLLCMENDNMGGGGNIVPWLVVRKAVNLDMLG